MYVCGMTVYDHSHVGHARVMVVFDVVVRYLRSKGYEVTYIRNITDIDDKIIARANENDEPYAKLTERFIKAMHEDIGSLGVIPPSNEPRATQYMDKIQKMIGILIERGYAYQADNGDIYYRVRSFKNYGALSGKSIDDLLAGARVEVGEQKDDPLDFVLWKVAKTGEPQWESAWGPGRPGWHIECSAMSTACLGMHFDIHGGGMDLVFPHHDNEIAQSEGATGEKFVNTWMHVGFVRVNKEKMSKSLGNFFTVREVLQRYDPEVMRYFFLASHYRSPLDYSDVNLDSAKSALTTLYTALRGIVIPESRPSNHQKITESADGKPFFAAMDDDFNTANAIAVLFELARQINRAKEGRNREALELAARLRHLGGILGLLQRDPEEFLKGEASHGALTDEAVEAKIAARNAARERKDFLLADRIRDELADQGVALEDNPGGETLWRRR
jgi:cysteinyl-tRNA synthetase